MHNMSDERELSEGRWCITPEQAYREGVKLALAHHQVQMQQVQMQQAQKAAEYPLAFSPPPPVAMPPLPDPMIFNSDKGHLASSIIHARAGNKKLQNMALANRFGKVAAEHTRHGHRADFPAVPDAESHKRMLGMLSGGMVGGGVGTLSGGLLGTLAFDKARRRVGSAGLGGALGSLAGGYAGYQVPEIGGAAVGAGLGAGLGGAAGASLGGLLNSDRSASILAALGGLGGLGVGGYAGYKMLQPEANR